MRARKSSVTKRFFADAMVDPPPIGNKGALWNEIQGKNREEGVLAQPHCHVVPPGWRVVEQPQPSSARVRFGGANGEPG